MLHRIGNKLRQQIHIFYRELCTSMVQVSSLLVEDPIIDELVKRSFVTSDGKVKKFDIQVSEDSEA